MHCVTDDSFDPAPIAKKLIEVADKLQNDNEFQEAVRQLKQAQLQAVCENLIQIICAIVIHKASFVDNLWWCDKHWNKLVAVCFVILLTNYHHRMQTIYSFSLELI